MKVGDRSRDYLPYGKQTISEDDIAAVADALRSPLITQGPVTELFESNFAELCGAKHAVACCNGTAALHLAMLAARIGPGDRVVTTPNTFLASANCAAYAGATPDFADIDPVSYCLSPKSLEENWKDDTKAVVAVDFAGQPANMPKIAEIARSRGAVVIEDACHAIGGQFTFQGNEYRVGGHPWSDITTFSFHPVKTMTSGEGGMVVTDNDELADRVKLLRNHGMVRDADKFTHFNTGGYPVNEPQAWHLYEMQDLGYNFRLSDIHAALGVSQLKRLTEFVERRRAIVAQYNSGLQGCEHLVLPNLAGWLRADPQALSWHLYSVQFDLEALGVTRASLMERLRDEWGVGVQAHYLPVHLQPYYAQSYGYGKGKCPEAEKFGERCLSLPLYPTLSRDEVDSVIAAVRGVVK